MIGYLQAFLVFGGHIRIGCSQASLVLGEHTRIAYLQASQIFREQTLIGYLQVSLVFRGHTMIGYLQAFLAFGEHNRCDEGTLGGVVQAHYLKQYIDSLCFIRCWVSPLFDALKVQFVM